MADHQIIVVNLSLDPVEIPGSIVIVGGRHGSAEMTVTDDQLGEIRAVGGLRIDRIDGEPSIGSRPAPA
jgi:hypothetical protein